MKILPICHTKSSSFGIVLEYPREWEGMGGVSPLPSPPFPGSPHSQTGRCKTPLPVPTQASLIVLWLFHHYVLVVIFVKHYVCNVSKMYQIHHLIFHYLLLTARFGWPTASVLLTPAEGWVGGPLGPAGGLFKQLLENRIGRSGEPFKQLLQLSNLLQLLEDRIGSCSSLLGPLISI